jgi:hypothetical protein
MRRRWSEAKSYRDSASAGAVRQGRDKQRIPTEGPFIRLGRHLPLAHPPAMHGTDTVTGIVCDGAATPANREAQPPPYTISRISALTDVME